jgi:methionine-rich copper-binding protein CopC
VPVNLSRGRRSGTICGMWYAVLLVASLFLGAAEAQAHAHLERAQPADGSVLTTAPARLVLSFSESARLTALSIEAAGGKPRKLAPLPAQSAREISVALPPLAPGEYVVRWRVLSADGHIVPGRLHFTLR